MNNRFEPFIAGKPISLSKTYFPVVSFFDSHYEIQIPDLGILDAKTSISKTKSSCQKVAVLTFEDRKKILEQASQKLVFSKEEVESCVKLLGMPISLVTKYLDDIKTIFEIIPQLIEKRVGIKNGKISGFPIAGQDDMLKILHPIDGFVYVVTPGNDPRVTGFVVAWLVSLGLPGIFKSSKTDFPIARKILQTIVDAGYPKEALSLMSWDTSNVSKQKLHFEIVDASNAVWAFGDNDTVSSILRWQILEDGSKIDHFSDKLVIKHTNGRSAAVCSPSSDIKKMINLIVESSINWPIGCNSLKAIFDASGKNSELLDILTDKFIEIGKYTGDPMDKRTKIGNVSKEVLSLVSKRADSLSSLGQLEKVSGEFLSENQSTPLLFKTLDPFSEFLSTEFSCYLLTVKKCPTYSDAVRELNLSAGENKRLATIVFSEDEKDLFREYIHSHHIKHMRHSTELDIMFHEGNDYLHLLTRPQIHRITGSKTKSI